MLIQYLNAKQVCFDPPRISTLTLAAVRHLAPVIDICCRRPGCGLLLCSGAGGIERRLLSTGHTSGRTDRPERYIDLAPHAMWAVWIIVQMFILRVPRSVPHYSTHSYRLGVGYSSFMEAGKLFISHRLMFVCIVFCYRPHFSLAHKMPVLIRSICTFNFFMCIANDVGVYINRRLCPRVMQLCDYYAGRRFRISESDRLSVRSLSMHFPSGICSK